MFGLDDPLTLILMPGSLSDGMTPAQAAAFFQREQSAWNQFEESKAILRGAGWMLAKDKTDYLKGGKQSQRDASIFRYPKEFRRWYHREYKSPDGGPPNATERELEELYKEWNKMGKPNVK